MLHRSISLWSGVTLEMRQAVPIGGGEVFPLGLTPAAAHRYEALDSLRGICALCVCLFHFRASGPIALLPFVQGSWLFVDFFFVLSGFVIAANYRERLAAGMGLRGFAILRFGRVYPLHLAMLAAFVAMELVGLALAKDGVMHRQAFDAQHSVLAIFANLTLTQAFGIPGELTWNHPAWSIAVEFWTYLLFALAARRAAEALEKWLVGAIIFSIALLLMVSEYGINVTHGWSLFRCIYGFAVGAIGWRLWQGSGLTPAVAYRGATIVEIGMIAVVVAFVVLGAGAPVNLVAPLVFGAAVLVFARAGGQVSRALLASPLRTLGMLSFSIYMVHIFVQSRMDDGLRIIQKLFGIEMFTRTVSTKGRLIDVVGATPVQGTLLTLVMLGLVIAVSHLTWRWIEVPGQKLARQYAKREH